MALVSGRPISFQMDLYQPLYVPRPVVEPELFASLRPVAYSGGLDGLQRMAGKPAEKKPADDLAFDKKESKADGKIDTFGRNRGALRDESEKAGRVVEELKKLDERMDLGRQ